MSRVVLVVWVSFMVSVSSMCRDDQNLCGCVRNPRAHTLRLGRKHPGRVRRLYRAPPIAGNNVETTIDLELQGIAEDSLANIMEGADRPGEEHLKDESNGLDCGGAVIVMKVKTGEILACASYPTITSPRGAGLGQSRGRPLDPFLQHAFGTNYAPGSTFKMYPDCRYGHP